jgi:D-serine deaminase-like pyridoxal phosphate-dependent protein
MVDVQTTQEISTPALLLDLDAFESNLALMASHVRRSGKALRPHAKAHKCVEIARRQMAEGAVGLCVATVPEAELFSKAGISGLLLTSPLADPLKITRVVTTSAMVVVDHLQQVNWYQDAAYAAARHVDVLIDLDVGDHRTGATPDQAVAIALAIARSTHLKLCGLQAYSVSGSHAGPQADPSAGRAERKRISEAAFLSAATTRDELARQGLPTEILSGGSTGSWDIDTGIPAVTELQAGSYIYMDMAYGKLGLPFRPALSVLTTVISASHDAFVTVDGGFKAFSTDRGYGPEAPAYPGSAYRWGGDEFGYLDIAGCDPRPRLGDKIEFLPPHCDPTVNLYDRLYACRRGTVEHVWPIMDRWQPTRS